jgi:EmrB/QacA subfamily drug resistance transporter
MATTRTDRSAGVGFRSERGPVLAALMLSTGLVALDSTILATAVPSIVRDLGGFSQFPWLFSIYLLTQAVTVPLYGKFADVVGRKPVMYFGIATFLLGSVLCGFAWSMPALIAFRALQGVGAGAVQPMSMTIAGDLYTVEERAKVQGYIASVWGISSVLGPALGGVFSEYASWRWIFFVNVPLGIVATLVLARRFHEQARERKRHKIDYPGAALLIGGCSLLILGLLEGGVGWAWLSTPSLVVFVVSAVLLIGFVFAELRSAEPILPFWVFRHRVLTGGSLCAFAIGALTLGLSSYVPTFVQGVLGTGALVAGFALAALTVGWPLAGAFAGRVYMRIGFRDTALIGSGIVVVGSVLCALLPEDVSVWLTAAVCFVIGLGFGLTASPTLVAAQSVVGWERRGVVTGTNMFFRSMGSAVGVAVLGAIANGTLANRFAHPPAAVRGADFSGVDATSLVLGGQAPPSGPGVDAFIRDALYAASHHVFVSLIVVAVLGGLAVAVMPRKTVPLVFDDRTG